MSANTVKTPKSPRYPLPWAVDKMLILLDKEGIHPVHPDIIAQHLGYTNARNGQAATVLGTLRMYGLLQKAKNRMDVISEDVKKFKYTPYDDEKREITERWLKTPKLFATVLSKYPDKDNRPSDAALRYELIQEFNFTETAANKFLEILKDSIDYTDSFITQEKQDSTEPVIDEDLDTESYEESRREIEAPQPPLQSNIPAEMADSDESYKVQITGPGMNSIIEINEEEDLFIVEAMLKKVSKKIFTEE